MYVKVETLEDDPVAEALGQAPYGQSWGGGQRGHHRSEDLRPSALARLKSCAYVAVVTGIITWPLAGGVKSSSSAMLVLPNVKAVAWRVSSAFTIAVRAAGDSDA